MRIGPFRFNLQELGGALGDLGTLVPLATGLILVNGLNATSVLVAIGLFYIGAGLYFRAPVPVQPLKAVSAIAISLGLSGSVIGASSLLMGAVLLTLSLTNMVTTLVRLFPRAVVRGIQLGIGVMLLRRGIELAMSERMLNPAASRLLGVQPFSIGIPLAFLGLAIFVLFQFLLRRRTGRFPSSLALIGFGLVAGVFSTPIAAPAEINAELPGLVFPHAHDFWIAFTVLVIPQLPLTLGNAVVGTSDTARVYFKESARRMTPRALSASMGVANIAAGLFGAMPMCHGSGGLTAHYRMGARTGGASIMIGGLVLACGVFLGRDALKVLSLIPLPVLGALLAIVGVYHALLVRDLTAKSHLLIAATVAIATIIWDNLALGFAAGIVLHYVLNVWLLKASPEGVR